MHRQNISQLLAATRILVSAPATGSALRSTDRPVPTERWLERVADRMDRLVRRVTVGPGRRYREHILSTLRWIEEQGPATTGFYRPEMGEVFVDVAVSPVQAPAAGLLSGDSGPDYRHSIDDFLDRRSPAVLAILGGPGVGKTMLLRRIARQACTARDRRRTVPVLLYLRDHVTAIVGEPSTMLSQLAYRQIERNRVDGLTVSWFERRLRAGSCVVLLDGLDEVATAEHRQVIAGWIGRQIACYPKNDFVVTSRPHGYRWTGLRGATVLQARAFTADQVSRFVRRWYVAIENRASGGGDDVFRRAEMAADDLLYRIGNLPGLAHLTVNPLLLTMIVNVHWYRGAIPGSRADLYDEICEVALWRRSEAKKLGSEIRGDRKKAFLAYLAFGMMSEQICEVTRDRLADAAHQVLGRCARPPDVDNALRDILADGLVVEREQGVYAFAHLCFQEHLAAKYIHDRNLVSVLTDNVGDPWWHETTLLYASRQDAGAIVHACLESGSPAAISLAFDCAAQDSELSPELLRDLEKLAEQRLGGEGAAATS